MSPSDIVRKTGIHRPATYKSIAELERMQLVQSVPYGKYIRYTAASPQRLEQLFETLEDQFGSEIFKMNELYATSGKKPMITFSEGEDAIKNLFSDIVNELKPGDTYYRYSPRLSLARSHLVPKDFRQKRDRKQIERMIITDNKSARTMTKKLGKAIKYIPENINLFDTDVSLSIYGDKVSLIDYNSLSVITIKNSMIAEFQKQLFKMIWKGLVQ